MAFDRSLCVSAPTSRTDQPHRPAAPPSRTAQPTMRFKFTAGVRCAHFLTATKKRSDTRVRLARCATVPAHRWRKSGACLRKNSHGSSCELKCALTCRSLPCPTCGQCCGGKVRSSGQSGAFETVGLSAGYRLRGPGACVCNWSGHVVPIRGLRVPAREIIEAALRPIVEAARVLQSRRVIGPSPGSSPRGSGPQVPPTAPGGTTVPSARITAYPHWGGSM